MIKHDVTTLNVKISITVTVDPSVPQDELRVTADQLIDAELETIYEEEGFQKLVKMAGAMPGEWVCVSCEPVDTKPGELPADRVFTEYFIIELHLEASK